MSLLHTLFSISYYSLLFPSYHAPQDLLADGQGLPVGGTLESASPAEVKLAPDAIINASERLGRWPCRLIADKAYDADRLRQVLRMVGG